MSEILQVEHRKIVSGDWCEPAADDESKKVCLAFEGLWLSPRALYRVENGNTFRCCKVFDDHYGFWLGEIAMIVDGSNGNPRFLSAKQAFRSRTGETNWMHIKVEVFKKKLVKYFPRYAKNCTNGKIEIYTKVLEHHRFI